MRVIAGTAKGHSLKSLKGLLTRPTLDQVREALFNVLAPRICEAKFLDLYAGTGAIGIEALSRGARMCVFCERQKKACEIIAENLHHCRLFEKAKIYPMEADKLIRHLQCNDPIVFDLVYMDPPYQAGVYESTLDMLSSSGLTGISSLVIAESGKGMTLPARCGVLELIKKSEYGNAALWYYQHT